MVTHKSVREYGAALTGLDSTDCPKNTQPVTLAEGRESQNYEFISEHEIHDSTQWTTKGIQGVIFAVGSEGEPIHVFEA